MVRLRALRPRRGDRLPPGILPGRGPPHGRPRLVRHLRGRLHRAPRGRLRVRAARRPDRAHTHPHDHDHADGSRHRAHWPSPRGRAARDTRPARARGAPPRAGPRHRRGMVGLGRARGRDGADAPPGVLLLAHQLGGVHRHPHRLRPVRRPVARDGRRGVHRVGLAHPVPAQRGRRADLLADPAQARGAAGVHRRDRASGGAPHPAAIAPLGVAAHPRGHRDPHVRERRRLRDPRLCGDVRGGGWRADEHDNPRRLGRLARRDRHDPRLRRALRPDRATAGLHDRRRVPPPVLLAVLPAARHRERRVGVARLRRRLRARDVAHAVGRAGLVRGALPYAVPLRGDGDQREHRDRARGGLAPFIAVGLLAITGNLVLVLGYLAVLAAISLVAAARTPETVGTELRERGPASPHSRRQP